MSTQLQNKEINITCQINNLVITPLTCSAFVMELIKLLIYEKLQIPYPFSWLKTTVNRRKTNTQTKNEIKNVSRKMLLDRQYKIALDALEFLDDLSRQLHREFINENIFIDEVVLVFGTNFVHPTESYRINMPTKSLGHTESNHLSDIHKTVNVMMRNLVLNNEWFKVTESSFPPTNMYVLIKKNQTMELVSPDYFLPKEFFRIPLNTRKININFENNVTQTHGCCSYLQIFEDLGESVQQNNESVEQCNTNTNNSYNNDRKWFLAKSYLKGFKDMFIENKSVSNIW